MIAGYRSALERRLYPELGGARPSAISRRDVQDLAGRLRAEGLSPSTTKNALMPLRAIFRRAVSRGELGINPTQGVELPAARGRRERIAGPTEAASLIAALDQRDQAVWSTALYAGLRRGELQALRWEDVDLAAGVIRVERSYDPRAKRYAAPKSRAGRRRVPIVGGLRDVLVEHTMATGRREGLVFGDEGHAPSAASSLRERAKRRWKNAGLQKITLHGSRHTAASFMIAAGVNAKAITTYMGHASIATTFDLYGHLMPGNEDEAAALLERFLASAAEDAARAGAPA